MDINTILLLQEEQQLAAQQASEKNDQVQVATNSHFTASLSIDYLTTAATQAHTIASTSRFSKKPKAPSATPQHKIANLGGSGPGPSWTHNYPPAGGDVNPPQGTTNDPSVPPYSTNASNPGGDQGYLDKLYQFIANLAAEPNNLAQGQIFMQYLQNLTADGLLYPGSPADQFLQNLGKNDGGVTIYQLIDKYMDANAELAYFEGYTTPSGQSYPPGNGAAQAWIANQMNILNGLGKSSSYTQEMQNELNHNVSTWFTPNISGPNNTMISEYDMHHHNANGYYMNVPGAGIQYWNPSGSASPTATDVAWSNFLIYSMIAGSSSTQTPDPTMVGLSNGLDGINREYRMQIFEQLVAQFKNDPTLLLTMFIMQTTSNECDSQLSGQSDQTDRQTLITNQMSSLTQAAGTIGTMTPAAALQFIQNLNTVTGMVNTMQCTSGYAASFNQNVAQAFWNITIPSTTINGQTCTNMQEAFNACYPNGITNGAQPSAQWQSVINSINPTLPAGGTPPTAPGTPPLALQTFLNSLQQGAAMVSQQSKTISTISASISNLLDQVLKVMGFDLNPTSGGGGGYTALISSMVGNQISH
jgi:hypothetical protein